jgi:hypothetical protein
MDSPDDSFICARTGAIHQAVEHVATQQELDLIHWSMNVSTPNEKMTTRASWLAASKASNVPSVQPGGAWPDHSIKKGAHRQAHKASGTQ